MDMHKHRALLKQGQNLDTFEEDLRTLTKAKNLQSLIKTSKNENEIKEAIKYCHFYIYFEFIQETLMDLFRTSKSEEVKQMIVDLHNGDLDVSAQAEIIEIMKDYKEIQEKAEKAKDKFLNEFLNIDSSNISTENQMMKSTRVSG